MPEQNKLADPVAKDYIKNRMELIVAEMVQQAESRDVVKEIIANLKEKYDLKPAIIRKVATAMVNDKLSEVLENNAEATSLIATLK